MKSLNALEVYNNVRVAKSTWKTYWGGEGGRKESGKKKNMVLIRFICPGGAAAG